MVEAGMELAVSVAAIAVAGTVVEKVVERVVERAVERAVERVERVEKKIGDRWRRSRRIWRGRSVEEMAAAMAMAMGDDGRSDGAAAG